MDDNTIILQPIEPSTLNIRNTTQSTVVRVTDFAAPPFTDYANIFNKTEVTTLLAGKADVGHTHGAVTTSVNGFMTAADKTKLDGIATGANVYVHPTGDGNSHVPATGTTNNGKVLRAGATANSSAWGNVAFSELTFKPTTLAGYGITDAFSTAGNNSVATGDITLQNGQFTNWQPVTAGGWARGVVFKDTTGATTIGGVGFLGNGATHQNAYLGVGITPWTSKNISIDAVTGNATVSNNLTVSGSFNSVGAITQNGTAVSLAGHTQAFSTLTSLPTTLAGHGITDAYTKTQVQSKGMNLLTNGFGTTGDNTNFSGFTFSAVDVYSGGGAFLTSTNASSLVNDEYIPVDPNKYYRFTFAAKSITVLANNNYAYGYAAPFDIDNLAVTPQTYTYNTNTYTTLAAPLKPGDTTITLTTAANWDTRATSNGASNFVKIHSYKNSKGYSWAPQTYSRNVQASPYTAANVNLTTNVITLSTPWTVANPDDAVNGWPVGTPISTAASGGTYQYFTTLSNTAIPNAWTQYSGTIGGVADGSVGVATTKFPAGTAYIKLGFLSNRTVTGTGGTAGNVTAYSALHFTEGNVLNLTGGIAPSATNSVSLNGAVFNFNNGILTSATGAISGITDTQITSVGWSKILSKPTTLAGYGITDGLTAASPLDYTKLNATGTPSASTYLRGDGTWSAVVGGGTGDMPKATYDTNNSGVVDDSEKLAGIAATSYARTDLTNTFTKYQKIPYDTTQDTNLMMLGKSSPTSGQSVNGFDFKDAAGNNFTGGMYQIYSTANFYETRLYGKGNVVLHTNDGGGTVNGTVRFVTTNGSGTNAMWIVDNTKITAPDNSIVLTTKSTDRLGRLYLANEFLSSASTNEWVQYASGTGVTIAGNNNTALNNAVGLVRITTGTTATGRGAIGNAVALFRFNQATSTLRSILSLVTLSTSTETYVARVGYLDSVTGDATYGAYFRYTDGVNAGKWQAVIRNNGTETALDTGVVASAGALKKYEIVITPAGVVTFKIDGATVATNSANLAISAGSETGYGVSIIKTVGTTSINAVDVDFMDIEYALSTSR